MIRLSTNFFTFSFLIAVPPLLAVYLGHAAMLVPNFGLMYVFYFLVTYIVCAMVMIGQQVSDKSGAQLFLIATSIKLLACMGFAVLYVLFVPVSAYLFVLCFFYLYFLNTGFEIYTLLSNLRVQNKK